MNAAEYLRGLADTQVPFAAFTDLHHNYKSTVSALRACAELVEAVRLGNNELSLRTWEALDALDRLVKEGGT